LLFWTKVGSDGKNKLITRNYRSEVALAKAKLVMRRIGFASLFVGCAATPWKHKIWNDIRVSWLALGSRQSRSGLGRSVTGSNFLRGAISIESHVAGFHNDNTVRELANGPGLSLPLRSAIRESHDRRPCFLKQHSYVVLGRAMSDP